jgi:ribosomal protein L11 methyltransferase
LATGWHRIAVTIPAGAVDRVGDVLLAAGATGLMEDYPQLREEGPALSGDPGERAPPPPPPADGKVELAGYLPEDMDAAAALRQVQERLAAMAGFAGARPRLERVPDEDWGRSWREHYTALDVGRRLRIRPSWEPAGDGSRCEIVIDPGMAFGTGTHFTTAACLELLEQVLDGADRPLSVLDVGTGTGVLAIGAAQLGARTVAAFDTDAEAVEVAHANLTGNGVATRIELRRGTLDEESRRFDLVLANLLAPLLCRLAPDLAAAVADGGRLIASGLLVDQKTEVVEALAAAGLSLTEARSDGEWVALIVEK